MASKFSNKLFKDNDPRAREAGIKYGQLMIPEFQTLIVTENFESKFESDLVALEKLDKDTYKIKRYIEVEIKLAWDSNTYKFHDIRIPARKLRYSENTDWILFNRDLTAFFYIPNKIIEQAKIVSLKNRLSKNEKEEFLSIDPKDAKLKIIDDGFELF